MVEYRIQNTEFRMVARCGVAARGYSEFRVTVQLPRYWVPWISLVWPDESCVRKVRIPNRPNQAYPWHTGLGPDQLRFRILNSESRR